MSIPRDTQSLHSSTPKRITFNTVANSETSTIGESPYELELPEKQWFQALIVAQSGKTAQMLEHIFMINKENNPYNKLAEWHDPLTGYNVLHFAIIRGDSDLQKKSKQSSKYHVFLHCFSLNYDFFRYSNWQLKNSTFESILKPALLETTHSI